MNNQAIRVAVLSTHPIQYQAPLWRKLAQMPDLEIHVFYGAQMGAAGYVDKEFGVQVKWDVALTSDYPHTFLPGAERVKRVTSRKPSGQGLAAALSAGRFQVMIVNAYSSVFWLRGLLFAKAYGIPVVMRHEASDSALQRSWLKSVLRDVSLKLIYALVRVFACIGTEARWHLTRLGVASERLVESPYCIDSDLFENHFARWHPERDSLRKTLGIAPDAVVLLFCGKLIPKKNPLLLFAALRELAPALLARVHVLVVGDGELREAVQQAGAPLLGSRLTLAGFVNQSEMGRWYAVADSLVLPSRRGAGETWGLVVNEALQFGLPALVSSGVGCAPDLIVEGETGFVFESGNAGELAGLIRRLLAELPAARDRYRQACRQRVAGFGARQAAEGLHRAIRLAAAQTTSAAL